MSEYVTHKELMEALLEMQKENKKDRNDFSKIVSGSIDSLHKKMDEVVILNEKIKNHAKAIEDLENSFEKISIKIESIDKKILYALGFVSAISTVGGTGVTFLISYLTK